MAGRCGLPAHNAEKAIHARYLCTYTVYIVPREGFRGVVKDVYMYLVMGSHVNNLFSWTEVSSLQTHEHAGFTTSSANDTGHYQVEIQGSLIVSDGRCLSLFLSLTSRQGSQVFTCLRTYMVEFVQ